MRVQTSSTHGYEESPVLFIFEVLQLWADLLIAIPLTLRQASRCFQCVLIFAQSYVALSGAFTKLRNTISTCISVCRYVLPNDRASRSDSSRQRACPFYTSRPGSFFLGGGAKHLISQICQPPHSPDLAPCDFWLFPKLKSPLKLRRFVNATVTQYTISVKEVSLPTD